MRIEQAGRWPRVPWWAVALVALHAALAGAYALATRDKTDATPPLCLFRRLTGYPCPTCGATRMGLALLRGHWIEALRLNPLVFALVVGGVLALLARVGLGRRIVWNDSPRSRTWVTAAFVAAILANWIYVLTLA